MDHKSSTCVTINSLPLLNDDTIEKAPDMRFDAGHCLRILDESAAVSKRVAKQDTNDAGKDSQRNRKSDAKIPGQGRNSGGRSDLPTAAHNKKRKQT